MEISFNELRLKEVINLNDGAKLGHVLDVVFDGGVGGVLGIVVPGVKKIFKKSSDIFIPIEKVRRIGDDVILVRFEVFDSVMSSNAVSSRQQKFVSSKIYNKSTSDGNASFLRYRKLDYKKYK